MVKSARESRREATVRLLNNPDEWPNPVLPMIKDGGGVRGGLDGVVINKFPTTVFEANLFMLPTNLLDAKRHVYDSVEDMMADGWEVD